MNRKKAVFKPIVVAENDMQYLKTVLSSTLAPYRKNDAVRKIVGGYCVGCGGIPTQKVCFNVHGATVIERYCDQCISERKFTG